MMYLLSLFRGVTLKGILYAVAAAVLALGVYFGAQFIDAKYTAEAEIARLEQEVTSQKDAIRILNQAAVQKDRAIEAADAARAELEALREDYDEIVRDADTVKEEDDGEIAPVLRRTLDALSRL